MTGSVRGRRLLLTQDMEGLRGQPRTGCENVVQGPQSAQEVCRSPVSPLEPAARAAER